MESLCMVESYEWSDYAWWSKAHPARPRRSYSGERRRRAGHIPARGAAGHPLYRDFF